MKRDLRFIAILVLAAISGTIVSCDRQKDDPLPGDPVPIALTLKQKDVIDSANKFAFDLFVPIVSEKKGSENIMISPFSISSALSMVLNGAAGETFNAVRNTLRYDGKTLQEINETYLKLMKEMVPLKDAKNAKKNELNLLVVAEKPNKSAITKKVAEVADISRRLTEKKTLHHLEVREMLTPEQRLKFDMHLLRQGAIGHGDRARGGMGPGMMGGMMGQH